MSVVSGLWRSLLSPFTFSCLTCKQGHYLPQLLARRIKTWWSSKAFVHCKVLCRYFSCCSSHYVLSRYPHTVCDAAGNTGHSLCSYTFGQWLRSAALHKYYWGSTACWEPLWALRMQGEQSKTGVSKCCEANCSWVRMEVGGAIWALAVREVVTTE